jgi:TIGR03009 family protein
MHSVRKFAALALTLNLTCCLSLFAQGPDVPAQRQSQQQPSRQGAQPPSSPPSEPSSATQQAATQQAAQAPSTRPSATDPSQPVSSGGAQATSTTSAQRQLPFEPMSPEQQLRVDQLLSVWESRSAKVKTYSCVFTRWEYDAVFGPKNPNWPKTQSEGLIRFSSPDKGEFRVEKIGKFQPPAAVGESPKFPMKKEDTAEHWICNGESVYELNAKKKQLIERTLPPEMQGNQIADGPLPFMFGAKKDKLKRRYWIRELTPPPNRKGEYWLEAYPRLPETAAEFQRIRVILDEKTFLPNALEVYPPNYNARSNPSRTVYVFRNRSVNDPLHRGQEFFGRFISPKTPRGWKKIVQNFSDPAPAPSVANGAEGTRQAQRQAAPGKR